MPKADVVAASSIGRNEPNVTYAAAQVNDGFGDLTVSIWTFRFGLKPAAGSITKREIKPLETNPAPHEAVLEGRIRIEHIISQSAVYPARNSGCPYVELGNGRVSQIHCGLAFRMRICRGRRGVSVRRVRSVYRQSMRICQNLT